MSLSQKQLEKYLILLANDKEILGEIYDATYEALYAFIVAIVKDREIAKDLTHDTYLTIYKNINRYQAQGHPMAWIYAIAKNNAMMYIRKNQNEVTIEDNLEIATKEVDVITNVTVESILSTLKTEEKEIVVMRHLSEMSFKDISKILELPLATVLSKYHRTMKKLKKEVQK